MWYTLFKSTHVICALVSYLLFVSRGIWIFRHPGRERPAWVRVVPHVVDSLLLASAVGLVLLTRQYPGNLPWLDVKIACLLLYIALGMAAFRFLRGRARIAAWLLAQAVFGYIVLVALTRNPSIV